MTPERYEQVCQICYDALHLEAGQRAAFIENSCAADISLRQEVEAMLANKERVDSFLSSPALAVAASQTAEDLILQQSIDQTDDQPTGDIDSSFSEPHAEFFGPGKTLSGRYLIEKELGHGGISTVFLAHDQKLHNTPVVIKVLLKMWEQTVHKAWYEKKFKEEIAALARIDHPGVVRALDVGELPDGRSYLVMQYVSGASLRDVMSPTGIELKRVAGLMRQIGQALAAAHQRGVIHRDLKPENIMLQKVGDEEYVKLIDFGIATVHEMHEMSDLNDSQTTAIVGTRSYVAPEQLRGKPVPASDIYALGVIAYEMVTGRRPFDPESIIQLYEVQRLGVRVKPCDLCPDLPEAAQVAILKALSFDPKDRFKSAKDFTDTLASALSGEEKQPVIARPHFIGQWGREINGRPRSIGNWPLLLVSLLIVGGLFSLSTSLRSVFRDLFTTTATPTPAPIQTRHLTIQMKAQRDPKIYRRGTIFQVLDNALFGPLDQLQFKITCPESGYLYVINEGPVQTDTLPQFNVLFADTERKDGSPDIAAGQEVQIPRPTKRPERDWFVFDHEEGTEKIWFVWSKERVSELGDIKKWVNPEARGEIGDLKQRKVVQGYLNSASSNELVVERDEASKRTRLLWKGETLVWMMKLEHK